MANITIQADGFKITEALSDHIKAKLRKLDRYPLNYIKVLLKMDKRKAVVELSADNHFLKSDGIDMYSTITKSADTMQEIIERSKTLG